MLGAPDRSRRSLLLSGVGGEILSVTVLKTAIAVEKLVCKVNLYPGLKRIISTIINNNNMHSIIQSTNNNK